MHKNVVAKVVVIGLMFAPIAAAPALAEENYFIELGQDSSPTVVASEWRSLVQKHKAQLGPYQLFPKEIVQSGTTMMRIQAGPIAAKDKAQKICTRLFMEGIPCFVMEGVSSAPPTRAMSLSEESMVHPIHNGPLPWTAEPVDPAIFAAPPPENQQLENRQAQVHVAEAVRVPLTQTSVSDLTVPPEAPVSVAPLPEVKPLIDGRTGHYVDESSDSGQGWLVVEFFPDEEIATSFWGEVGRASPAKFKNLHMKVLHSVLANDPSKVSLALGAFASSSDAYGFCRSTVQADARGLTCRFSHTDPANSPPASVGVEAASVRSYWIQVVSAASQPEALQAWETIKAQNDDVVHGLRNHISVSNEGNGEYVVRLGPVEDHEMAVQACSSLKSRGVDCRVILALAGKS